MWFGIIIPWDNTPGSAHTVREQRRRAKIQKAAENERRERQALKRLFYRLGVNARKAFSGGGAASI
jgi:hypothetical protein